MFSQTILFSCIFPSTFIFSTDTIDGRHKRKRISDVLARATTNCAISREKIHHAISILPIHNLPHLPPRLFPPSVAPNERGSPVNIRKDNLLKKILGLIGLKTTAWVQ